MPTALGWSPFNERVRSLRAGRSPGYLPDNGKRILDRRYGVARDPLCEKLLLLIITVVVSIDT